MNRVLEVLLEKVRDDLAARRNAMADGQCASFEQYKELAGTIRGLVIAERHITDLARNMDEDND